MLLYQLYRRYFALCGILLTLLAYAMLLTAHGMATPRFVLDPTAGSVKHASSFSLRRISDTLAGRKYAVLTFDDGPYGYGVDEQILSILRKHHAHAVFFLVCSHINDANRDELGRMESEGNLIGNHSLDHLELNKLDKAQLVHEIDGCSRRLADITGKRPYYFRPPFGASSPLVAEVARSFGMKQMLWNANSQDSWLTKPEQILNWSVEQTDDQSILLLHEKPTTVAVLDEMLTKLEDRGFHFVLPDQLADGSTAIN